MSWWWVGLKITLVESWIVGPMGLETKLLNMGFAIGREGFGLLLPIERMERHVFSLRAFWVLCISRFIDHAKENIWSEVGVKPLIYTTDQWTPHHIFNETHIHSSTHNYNPIKLIILIHIQTWWKPIIFCVCCLISYISANLRFQNFDGFVLFLG